MSKAGDIADAVVTAVRALALTGVPEASVVRRKVPTLPHGADPPQVVVTVGEESIEPMTARKDLVRYPLAVTIVTPDGKKLVDDDALRLWREQIRAAVNTPAAFTTVTGFSQVDPTGKAPFNQAALANGLNYSVLLFTVQVRETRS